MKAFVKRVMSDKPEDLLRDKFSNSHLGEVGDFYLNHMSERKGCSYERRAMFEFIIKICGGGRLPKGMHRDQQDHISIGHEDCTNLPVPLNGFT